MKVVTANRHAWLCDGYTNLIVLGVYALVISLLIGRGTYNVALGIMAIGLIWQSAAGEQRLYTNGPLRWFLVSGMLLFVQGFLAATGPVGKSPYVILWCMLATLGVMQFPRRDESRWLHEIALKSILIAFVVMHLIFTVFMTGWRYEGRPGMFSNIHFMSQYAVITLPLLAFATKYSRPQVRGILALAILGDVWLLLASRSRPGYLAIVAATLVVIPFIASHLRWRILVIMAIVLGIIYYGNIANFSTRVEDLVANFSMDERWEIWLESIRLQQNSTGLQWLFGHGLGRFVYDYQVVSQLHGIKLYVGPHNFIMEILYSHGVLGLLVVTLLLGWFFCRLVVVTWREGAGIDKGLGMLLISVATAQLAHGFFTIPFFSRDYLLPFSFVLGAGFMYIDKSVK